MQQPKVDLVELQAAFVAGFVEACLDETSCDHTFHFRDEALTRWNLLEANAEAIRERLTELGGRRCDCELLHKATPALLTLPSP